MPLAPTDPDDVRHNAWWRFSASENRRFAMANFVTGGRLRPERAQRGRAVLATALPPFRPTPR